MPSVRHRQYRNDSAILQYRYSSFSAKPTKGLYTPTRTADAGIIGYSFATTEYIKWSFMYPHVWITSILWHNTRHNELTHGLNFRGQGNCHLWDNLMNWSSHVMSKLMNKYIYLHNQCDSTVMSNPKWHHCTVRHNLKKWSRFGTVPTGPHLVTSDPRGIRVYTLMVSLGVNLYNLNKNVLPKAVRA